jgi:hypothetical protein
LPGTIEGVSRNPDIISPNGTKPPVTDGSVDGGEENEDAEEQERNGGGQPSEIDKPMVHGTGPAVAHTSYGQRPATRRGSTRGKERKLPLLRPQLDGAVLASLALL